MKMTITIEIDPTETADQFFATGLGQLLQLKDENYDIETATDVAFWAGFEHAAEDADDDDAYEADDAYVDDDAYDDDDDGPDAAVAAMLRALEEDATEPTEPAQVEEVAPVDAQPDEEGAPSAAQSKEEGAIQRFLKGRKPAEGGVLLADRSTKLAVNHEFVWPETGEEWLVIATVRGRLLALNDALEYREFTKEELDEALRKFGSLPVPEDEAAIQSFLKGRKPTEGGVLLADRSTKLAVNHEFVWPETGEEWLVIATVRGRLLALNDALEYREFTKEELDEALRKFGSLPVPEDGAPAPVAEAPAPAAEAPAPAPAAEAPAPEAEAPAPAAEAEAVDEATVRALMSRYVGLYSPRHAANLMRDAVGATKMSAVKPEDYGTLAAALTEAMSNAS